MVGDVVTYGFLRAIGMDPQAAQGTNSNTQQQSSGAARPGPEGATCSPLQPPIKFHQQLLPRKYCAAPKPGGPGVFMAAQQPQTFQPVAQTGCWRFVEDRPGKPGKGEELVGRCSQPTCPLQPLKSVTLQDF